MDHYGISWWRISFRFGKQLPIMTYSTHVAWRELVHVSLTVPLHVHNNGWAPSPVCTKRNFEVRIQVVFNDYYRLV